MKKSFFLQVALLAFICSALILSWNTYAPLEKHLNALWLILSVFLTTTIIVHYVLTRSALKKPAAFVRTFMGAISIKLFIYLTIIILYCLFNRQQAIVFIMGFLIFYIIFSIFEVISVLHYLKRPNSNNL